ncbi:MAG: AmmeMemoRadiSam system protein A, partial [Nanoarchaeota archaeon]|nr:AmmeMemoRadiSam system protein A [Nanoarchaeota archaeon]
MVTKKEGEELIKLARKVIESRLDGLDFDEMHLGKVSHLNKNQGVFVTIKINGELRGCIGYPLPVFPLYEAVMRSSDAAAFNDPRFPPLSKKEYGKIKLELSVMTNPKKISVVKLEDYKKKVKVGQDGLIVSFHGYSGLLLPQVATEYGWDAEDFLGQTCV